MDPFRSPAIPSRPCPRCEMVGLGTRHVLDVSLDECSECTGVFVPGKVVRRLLDPLDLGLEVVGTFAPGEPERETSVRYLRCPRCAAMMNRRLLIKGSNVVVDQCTPHGVWFDAHELRSLAEHAARHDTAVKLDPELPPRAKRPSESGRPIDRDQSTLLRAVVEVMTRLFK